MITGIVFWFAFGVGFWFRGTRAAKAIIGWLRPSAEPAE